jgi:hypothetical protein
MFHFTKTKRVRCAGLVLLLRVGILKPESRCEAGIKFVKVILSRGGVGTNMLTKRKAMANRGRSTLYMRLEDLFQSLVLDYRIVSVESV